MGVETLLAEGGAGSKAASSSESPLGGWEEGGWAEEEEEEAVGVWSGVWSGQPNTSLGLAYTRMQSIRFTPLGSMLGPTAATHYHHHCCFIHTLIITRRSGNVRHKNTDQYTMHVYKCRRCNTAKLCVLLHAHIHSKVCCARLTCDLEALLCLQRLFSGEGNVHPATSARWKAHLSTHSTTDTPQGLPHYTATSQRDSPLTNQ